VRNSDAGFACARFDQLGANNILELYADGLEVFRFEKDGDLVSPFLTSAGGIYTFTQIPILPASDPTTANQAARKDYIDTRRIRWAVTFIYPDLSTKAVDSNFDQIQGALIPGSTWVATHIFCKVASGGTTGGAIITIRKQPFGNQTQTDLGGFNINSAGGDVTTLGVGVEHSNSPLPHSFTANDFVYPLVTSQAGINAKMVWVGVRGYRLHENP
jgi:hypothetical protein